MKRSAIAVAVVAHLMLAVSPLPAAETKGAAAAKAAAEQAHKGSGTVKRVDEKAGKVNLADDGQDETLYNQWSLTDQLLTVVPGYTAAEGDPCYFLKTAVSEYNPTAAEFDEILGFTFAGVGRGEYGIRGIVFHNATRTTTSGCARRCARPLSSRKSRAR